MTQRQYNAPAIDQDVRSHPWYDFDMEVLLSLPRWSRNGYVSHADIAWDHRLKTQKPVVEAIERLRRRFKIKTWNSCGERVSALLRMNYEEAQVAALEYWSRVHGTA
jgi:hypothetical protein